MKKEFKIEIETTGDYKNRKEFNRIAMLTEREFTKLINVILDYLDDPEINVPKQQKRYMKKALIKQFTFAEVDAPKEYFGFLRIPVEHTLIRAEGENLEVSDGYHTFDELYDHRIELFITLCRSTLREDEAARDYGGVGDRVWRSNYHSDGTAMPNWFIMGINTEKGQQITYHIPLSRWEDTNFAPTLEKAPEWDGHTSDDVIQRLKNL